MNNGTIEVYVLIGTPGAGKTDLVEDRFEQVLSQELENTYVLHISAEETIKNLGGELDETNGAVSNSMYKQLDEALIFAEQVQYDQNATTEIYYDARNLNRRRRRALYRHVKEVNPEALVIGAVVCVSLLEAMARNTEREEGHKVSEETIRELYTELQIPRLGADCDVMSVTGEPMFEHEIKELTCQGILDAAYKDYKAELNVFQSHGCSPHHTEPINEHIENAVKLAKSNRTKHVALFHDLGKPICRKEDDTGYSTYMNHANVGAYYLLNYMYSLRLLNISTTLTTEDAEIVQQHMNAHGGIGERNIKNNNLLPLIDRIYAFAQIDKKAARPKVGD